MQRNIEEQLERLLSQLSDIEEVQGTDDISPEELQELKQETEEQITQFEAYLKRLLVQNAEMESAKAAQKRIDEAKGKVFGIKEAKKVFEENQSVTLREKLRKIKQEKGNNIADESVR